jgi:thiol-disulfide isomerase/thioredoxin
MAIFAIAVLVSPPLERAAFAGVGVGSSAPEVTGETWLNSPSLRIADLSGKVVLVEFWTFACWNCRNVEPHVKDWQRRYGERGLVVIGVHSPELPQERELENVREYVREHAIQYPVAVDNGFATWKRYGNQAWPALYLIDKRGRVRFVHVGEGRYEETERAIEGLLAEG